MPSFQTVMTSAAALLMSAVAPVGDAKAQQAQIDVRRVSLMPDRPTPYALKDWHATALAYDKFVFDETLTGDHLPLIWWNERARNVNRRTFGLPSYAGGKRDPEGINCIAAVLGATLVGIDKSTGAHDYVSMVEQYFNSANGENVVLNNVKGKTGNSFWYELWPQVMFLGLVDRYPGKGDLDRIMRVSADRWHEACVALGFPDTPCDFDFTSFDFKTMKPVNNGKWVEPDSAGAIAWVQYMAYQKFGDEKYLKAADWCMASLQRRTKNPHYEVLCALGAYVAARMNAEHGRQYDVEKILNWSFDPNSVRKGWGVIAERWGEYDCHGLVGSTTDRGGYAFAMNTYAAAGILVPLARYDDRYARTLGKWVLNASNASRLYYADALPADHQSCPEWTGDPGHVIAYEGLRKAWKGKGPFAIGDPTTYWDMPLDFGLYGSSHVGFFGAMIRPTDVPMILQLDLLGTEFFKGKTYPTYLYFNPHSESKTVSIDVGSQPRDVYDTVEGCFLSRQQQGKTSIDIPASGVRVVVLTPTGGKLTTDKQQLRVDGVVVDFDAPAGHQVESPAR